MEQKISIFHYYTQPKLKQNRNRIVKITPTKHNKDIKKCNPRHNYHHQPWITLRKTPTLHKFYHNLPPEFHYHDILSIKRTIQHKQHDTKSPQQRWKLLSNDIHFNGRHKAKRFLSNFTHITYTNGSSLLSWIVTYNNNKKNKLKDFHIRWK